MAKLEWSDELSCSFEEFDTDHKRLIELYNNFHQSVDEGQDSDAVGDIFEELLSYTNWHFRHEERVMQEYEYEGYFEHKKIHEDLVAQATELYEKFLAGDVGVPGQLLPFLEKWLVEHILGTDKETGAYLAAQAG